MEIHFTIPAFSPTNLLFYIGVGVCSAYAFGYGFSFVFRKFAEIFIRMKQRSDKNRKEKWAKVGKDTVVLHHYLRGVVIPSPSPFALKLETYLRMAKIPYQNEYEPFYGPDVKTPWIMINGEEIFGSQSCVEYLARKFGKEFSSHLSPTSQATARAFQAICEEHLYWMLCLWRFVYTDGFTMPLISPLQPVFVSPWKKILWNTVATSQGIGRHSKKEVTEMAEKDLRALSIYLGSKRYFTGDKPTEVDCAMFGTLAEIVWTTPNSFMEKLVNGELINLKEFCERMKEEFWPDWNECLFASHFRQPDFNESKSSDLASWFWPL